MAAIYYGAALTQVPGPAAQVSDTVLHMGGYAGLALLTLRATAGGRWSGVTRRALALALVIAIAARPLGGSGADVRALADWPNGATSATTSIGALAGLVAVWAWGKLFKE